MDRYTVFYDGECGACARIKGALAALPTHLPVRYVPLGSAEGQERGRSLPRFGDDLVVAHDDGRAWVGPAAFVVVLSTLWGFRLLSWVLAEEPLRPLTLGFFSWLSDNRGRLAPLLGARCEHGACSLVHPYR